VPEVGRGDEQADSDPAGGERRGCECWDRAEPGKISMPAPREVIVGPGVRKAEFFSPLPADARLAPRMLRKNEDSDSERE
jgi:hypothetical protein